MTDMDVKRIAKEYMVAELTAKRAQAAPGASFAELLKTAGQTARTAQLPPPETSGPWASAPPPASAVPAIERRAGESGEAWQLRRVACETARRWQEGCRAWRAESAGMDPLEGTLYCAERAAQWAADLMEHEPALFRQWLEQERWHLQESGLDNAILPEGFTGADMDRWLSRGVLEYL